MAVTDSNTFSGSAEPADVNGNSILGSTGPMDFDGIRVLGSAEPMDLNSKIILGSIKPVDMNGIKVSMFPFHFLGAPRGWQTQGAPTFLRLGAKNLRQGQAIRLCVTSCLRD